MNSTPEKKSSTSVPSSDKTAALVETTIPPTSDLTALTPAERLKAAIQQLDADRTALVKNTIENLKPGKPFDQAVVREINKIETRKNRLIVARFAALLKKGEPGIQPIVHQIIEI